VWNSGDITLNYLERGTETFFNKHQTLANQGIQLDDGSSRYLTVTVLFSKYKMDF
jgi:hypothetical protein